MLEILAVGIGLLAYWFAFSGDTSVKDGLSRFDDDARKKIFDLLSKSSPSPQGSEFPDSTEFVLTLLSGVSAMTVIDGARTMNMPVAAKDEILGSGPHIIIVCKRGAEKNVAAPGSGFSLIVD